jgi:hypothetical protein
MSLLANHKLIGTGWATPQPVRSASSLNLSATTYTPAIGTQAAAGNLIVITSGGVQDRSVSSGPHTSLGFTRVNRAASGATLNVWYKISDGTEGLSFPIVYSGNLQGGWVYSEWSNVDKTVPYSSESHVDSGGISVSGIANTPYTIPYPQLVIYDLILSSATTSWILDSSTLNLGGLGATVGNPAATGTNSIYKSGYRLFGDTNGSVTATWTSSNSRTCRSGWMKFNGLPI